MVSFDTNILVYATISAPLSKTHGTRDLLVRGMRTGTSILLLQLAGNFVRKQLLARGFPPCDRAPGTL